MAGEFGRSGVALGRRLGMEDRAVDSAGGGKRAARVAVALDPLRAELQQDLIGRRGLFVATGNC